MKDNNRTTIEVFRFMFGQVHEYIEATMADVTETVARYEPGRPASILGQYAHLVSSEDWLINIKAGNNTPVMAQTNPGFQNPPPPVGWDEWARTEAVDLVALRAYAQEVYAATDAYLASVDDSCLNDPVDMSEMGFGMVPTTAIFMLALSNGCLHCGEISAIKGFQGLPGYPAVAVPEAARR
ncbi:MAG: hypothetical protein HND44_19295 [Chloroflexi bacterium]|nr:hypothetical protein [Chloroflexota bacterium]